MSGTLAIITAQLGTVSETFIRRHVEDLLPGRTVVVAHRSSHPAGGRWRAPCPVLFLDRFDLGLGPRLARRAGASPRGLRAFAVRRFLRAHEVSAVLGEYLDHCLEFVPLLDRMRLPYLVQGHGIDLSAALRAPEAARDYRAFGSASAVLTRCEFHRRRLIGLGLPEGRVHVNPGGVDIPDVVLARPEGAEKRFLAIGRMLPKKGPIVLLEAFRRALAEEPDVTLDYIGGGELLPAARQFVLANALENRIRLHGTVPEALKLELLGACGVFVQHSLTDPDSGDEEGLPAAIQEAMAVGQAVISTRHSGIPEAVEDGATGILVDEGDAAGMAAAILRLARGKDLAARYGAAGRAKAEKLYSWEAERARLLSHLRPLMGGRA